MAHSDKIVKKRTGQEIERLFLQVCAGMWQGIDAHERQKETNKEEAENMLKRSVDMPHRVQERIKALVSSQGETYVNECLVASGDTMTLTEINTELAKMREYTDEVQLTSKDQTLDQIAAILKEQVPKESDIYIVPIPVDYKDIWEKESELAAKG